MQIVLKKSFQILSKVKYNLDNKKLIWKTYIFNKTLLTTKEIEIINSKNIIGQSLITRLDLKSLVWMDKLTSSYVTDHMNKSADYGKKCKKLNLSRRDKIIWTNED